MWQTRSRRSPPLMLPNVWTKGSDDHMRDMIVEAVFEAWEDMDGEWF